jgi:hypothetical protein
VLGNQKRHGSAQASKYFDVDLNRIHQPTRPNKVSTFQDVVQLPSKYKWIQLFASCKPLL